MRPNKKCDSPLLCSARTPSELSLAGHVGRRWYLVGVWSLCVRWQRRRQRRDQASPLPSAAPRAVVTFGLCEGGSVMVMMIVGGGANKSPFLPTSHNQK